MPVEVTQEGRIATVRLDHGPVNALDLELCEELAATFEQLGADDEVGAIVLTGTDRAFSAGADLPRLLADDDGYGAAFLDTLARCFLAVFRVPRPTVAAVTGHAIAGGCVLACACDHAVAGDGGFLVGLTELAVGVPFPTSAVEIVRARVAPQHLAAAVLLAANHSPAEAQRIGFVTEVVPADRTLARAREVAAQLAAVPAPSYALAKEQLHRPADQAISAMTDVWEPRVVAAWQSDQGRAAIEAFMARLRR